MKAKKNKRKWNKTTFLNEFQSQPITGGQGGRARGCTRACVYLRRPTRRATWTPPPQPAASRWLLCGGHQGRRLLITWVRPASWLQHVNIKRGSFAAGVDMLPSRHAPLSYFFWASGTSPHVTRAPCHLRGAPTHMITLALNAFFFWKAYGAILDSTPAESERRWDMKQMSAFSARVLLF